MNRRTFLSAAAAATGIPLRPDFVAGRTVDAQPNPRSLIMDAMGELRFVYPADLINDMLDVGMDSITITLCDPKPTGSEALALAVDSLLEHDRYLDANPDYFVKATTIADLDEARRGGKMAVFYLFQNSIQFGDDLDRVDLFYRLGVTSAQITYNDPNLAGAGCKAPDAGGLTEFGRALVDRMNSVGMLIDLSHANLPTMTDTIEQSRLPVIISHSACETVHSGYRNTSDPVLRALAENGGLFGVCQMRPFLTDKKSDNLHAYFDHIDHAVKVCGVENVCIGSDRDHRVIELTPEYLEELSAEEGTATDDPALPYFIDELNGPRRMEVVWDGLVKRGYPSSDVERIMGLNLHRLYREVIG